MPCSPTRYYRNYSESLISKNGGNSFTTSIGSIVNLELVRSAGLAALKNKFLKYVSLSLKPVPLGVIHSLISKSAMPLQT